MFVACTTSTSIAQTFYRQYGNNVVNEGGQCVIASSDGNMFVGGFKDDSALVLKVDMLGNILWSRVFKPGAVLPSVIQQLEISPDGFLVGIGNDYDASIFRYRDGYFFKMDLAGNLIWLNRVNESREVHFESMHLFSITQYRIFMTVYDMASPTWADPASVLVDALTGNVISTTPRNNLTAIAYLDDQTACITNTTGNRIYGTGRIYVNGASQTSMRVFLTKYDIAGTLLSTSYLMYTAAQSSRLYGSDIAYNNDSIAISYFGDVGGASTNFTVGLIRCDTNGNVAWAKNYNIPSSTSEVSCRVLAHAGGYLIMGYTLSGGNDFFLFSVDRNGNLIWSRTYGSPGSTESLRAGYTPCLTIIGANIYFTGQSNSSGTNNIVIAAVDFSGNVSCMTTNPIAVTTLNNPTARTLLTPTTVSFSTNYTPPPITPVPQPISDACSNVNLDLGNDTAICSSLILNATLPSASSYLWSNGSTNPTLTVTTPGTYWATVAVNCCLYSDTIVIVSDTVPISNFTWTSANCSSVVSFSNTSQYASTYLWNFGDNTTSTGIASSHTYVSGGNYTVTLIATNGCGADTIVIPVVASSAVTVAAQPTTTTICPGNSISLSATANGGLGPITYSWNPGGSGSSINVSPVAATTYIVTATDSVGCTSSDTIQVNMIPPVLLSASADTVTCSGQSVTISASATNGGPYTWSAFPGNFQSITVSPTTTTSYFVSVIDTCSGLTLTDTVVVQVIQLPTAQFSATGPDCFGTCTFTNGTSGYTNLVWDFGDSSGDTVYSPAHQYGGSGTYNVMLIANNPCGSDTSYATIVVPPALNLSVNPTSVVVCAGDSTLLSASTSGGSGTLNYQWSPINNNSSTVMITPSAATTYYVTVTDSLGCTDIDSVSVTISSTATLSASGFNTICFGQSATISANASNGGPYTWSNNLGSNPSVSVSPTVTTTYYVSVFDSCSGNILVDSVTIVVMPPSVVAFSIDSSDGCAPLTVYFTDMSTTGQDQITGWLWYFGDGDSSSVTSPVHTYTTPGSYTITLTVVTSSGCVTTLVNGAVIDVYQVPLAGFTWNQSGSIGDQPEVEFTDQSVGASNWSWYFGDSAFSNLSDPFHTYTQTGDFIVMQVVGNNYGCYDTAYANIELTGEYTIYVPNTFTPGSGIYNNTFGGIGTGIVEYHLMVFDRWGVLIFKSDDYNYQWDGTFKGTRVQEDTYVWVIDVVDFMGGEHHLIGHINVIR